MDGERKTKTNQAENERKSGGDDERCGVVVYLMKSPLHTSQKVIELKQEGGRMINERGK
jgi:hypothetical protein